MKKMFLMVIFSIRKQASGFSSVEVGQADGSLSYAVKYCTNTCLTTDLKECGCGSNVLINCHGRNGKLCQILKDVGDYMEWSAFIVFIYTAYS